MRTASTPSRASRSDSVPGSMTSTPSRSSRTHACEYFVNRIVSSSLEPGDRSPRPTDSFPDRPYREDPMTATLPFVRVLAAVSVTGTLALAAAACASGTGAKSSSAAQPAAGGGAAAAPGAANNGAADKAGAPGQPAPPQPTGRGPEQAPVGNAADQRSIIYTGTITLRVSNVDEAAAKITGAAEGGGGFVGGH